MLLLLYTTSTCGLMNAIISSTAICEWIFQMASAEPCQLNISYDHLSEPLADELPKNGLVSSPTWDCGDGSPPLLSSLDQPAEPSDLNKSCNRARERKESENSDRYHCMCWLKQFVDSLDLVFVSSYPDAVEFLLEMFPEVSMKVVRYHLKKHRGDIDLTIQVLLELSKAAQSDSSKVFKPLVYVAVLNFIILLENGED